jgi:hypothetical protein
MFLESVIVAERHSWRVTSDLSANKSTPFSSAKDKELHAHTLISLGNRTFSIAFMRLR